MINIQERIADIFSDIANAINSIPINNSYEDAINALLDCKGKIITTGMGKAGHIARKFAATLCSTGTPAAYIHPGEAAHGDLGLIAPGDCVVAFSESGKTDEVIEMLQLGRHIGLKTIIGITAHIDSELRNLSDIVIEMGTIQEPCRLGLTPCACIAVMLAISDSLALVLMEKKGITRHDFGIRHHGGYLGKKSRLNND